MRHFFFFYFIIFDFPYSHNRYRSSQTVTTIKAYHLICRSIVQFRFIKSYLPIFSKDTAESQSISITFTKPKRQTFVSYKTNPHPKHISLAHIIHHPIIWSSNSIYHIICFFSKLYGDKEKLSTFISLTHRSDACVEESKIWVFEIRIPSGKA